MNHGVYRKVIIAVGLTLAGSMRLSAKTVTIGMVMDGPSPHYEEVKKRFIKEVREIVTNQDTVLVPAGKILSDTWRPDQIRQLYTKHINDPEVDIICALGAIASAEALKQTTFPKPVIAPFIVDYKMQDAPFVNGCSGVHNLCYMAMPQALLRDFVFFREVTGFNHCAFIINKTYARTLPHLSGSITSLSRMLGCTIDIVPAGASIDSTLQLLSEKVDAVYIANLMHHPASQFNRLVDGLRQRGLPSFSQYGASEVKRGILLSRLPDPASRIARRMAVNVHRIIMGEDPATFGVQFSLNEQLSLNMATAHAVGYEPPWHLFNEANIFGSIPTASHKRMSLRSAVKKVVTDNLTYRAQKHKTESTNYDVLTARSLCMPRLELGAEGLAVEEEVAAVAAGVPPQYSVRAVASLTQVLYSEEMRAGVAIAKHAHKAQRYLYKQAKLDVTADVASAYYDVLQALVLEHIARKTMEQSRNYLQLAHIRISVGTANKSEGYRWESRIAMNLKDLIEANAARNAAEIQLNHFLEQPHEQRLHLLEEMHDPSVLLKTWEYYNKCFKSKTTFKAFRENMVNEAIANSPELKAIDEGIAVQQRRLKTTRRAAWVPTLAAQARAEGVVFKDGIGADVSAPLPPGVSGPDYLNLTVGVSLSLPVYSGADVYSKIKAQTATMKQKELERQSTVRALEQRVRLSLHRCGAAYAGMEQARKAAGAAQKARAMVEDAYVQGAVSFTELSDAQTQEQIAEAASAQAVFSYLKMLMQVQRASGQFDFFRTELEMKAYKKRLTKTIAVREAGLYN